MNRLLIIGAGGHGRSVAEAVLLRNEYLLAGFLDDGVGGQERLWDWPILGATSMLPACRGQVDVVIVAIGSNSLREALHARIRAEGFAFATVIHPAAVVSPRAVVDKGCVVLAGAVIGTGAQLGEGVIVNSGAVVDHDCIVEPFAHLGVKAGMGGGSVLGRRAWMQVGASVLHGARVAPDQICTSQSLGSARSSDQGK
ncbi:NeuD/PglB/VioB family sugar acetyltransferase [Variovorax sp. ZS18.2.2]|uniref:NeuD/PglB/VioB family sugar acetyltransferase n=1 Tax=Variovorax sp. ZS18.2.2 TaxID=2971255 RepID=UPI0021517044|nr:NeuD/PglB/VioB family sugar acetyltransferase [Variovorax sp. ZS18.2.2]MCR6477492.1 NeuD/PglB/VioB family sugar acetyltransferase [Variovorax sp. ZS18.2.2]